MVSCSTSCFLPSVADSKEMHKVVNFTPSHHATDNPDAALCGQKTPVAEEKVALSKKQQQKTTTTTKKYFFKLIILKKKYIFLVKLGNILPTPQTTTDLHGIVHSVSYMIYSTYSIHKK